MSEDEDRDEFLNRVHGVEHAEFVRPSDAEPPRPPEHCQECGASDVRAVKKLPAFFLFLLLTLGIGYAVDQTIAAFLIAIAGAVYFVIAPRWRCAVCGNRW